MRRQYGVPQRSRLIAAAFCVPLAGVLAACALPSPADSWPAAGPDPPPLNEPAPAVWHARLPIRWRDRLAALCRLCDQYDLIDVASTEQWRAFCKAAGIEPDGPRLNFTRGRVVGVVAYVGEPLQKRWPVDIQAVGSRGRSGWIEARLRGGLFHPVCTPGFCVFTYVPRPYPVNLVKVANRVFYVWD